MKRGIIITGIILLIVISTWPTFGQPENQRVSNRDRERDDLLMFQLLSPEERAEFRGKWPDMSEDERGKFRKKLQERWNNLAEEEKEKLRSQSREGFESGRSRMLSREDQLNAVEVIGTQLAKLKSNVLTEPESGESSGDSPEEEENRLREQYLKAGREREKAIQSIIAQINVLQSERPLRPNTNNEEYVIIKVDDLKQVQELAAKEKANETALRIEWLIARSISRRSTGGRLQRTLSRPRDTRSSRPNREPTDTQESSNK